MALFIRTFVCATVAFAMTVATGQVNSSQPDNLVHISGRLVDSTGAPIADQTVTFRKEGPQDTKLKTDAQGVFSYLAERGVLYQVNLILTPFVFKGIGVIEIADGRDVAMGDIVLRFSPAYDPIVHFTGPVKITGETASSVPPPAQSTKATSIVAVYITCGETPNEFCAGGKMHIVFGNGREIQPPMDKDKQGSSWPSISEGKRSVGWLVDYGNPDYPFSLLVYRPGKPLRSFGGDRRPIFDWRFVSGGKQVAFYQDVGHGNPAPHYELRDIETGRLVSMWDGILTNTSPSWAEGLGTTPKF